MDLKELKALVRQGEGQHLEFKLKASHPEKIVREIVAFANSGGGTLLVGVGDDGSVPGLKFVDEEEYILTRAIEKLCQPPLTFQMDRIWVGEEREVLRLRIAPSPDKPHYVAAANPQDSKAYVRVADRSVQASREVREVMKGERKARNLRFEYGEKEKALMEYLASHERITVEEFCQMANIPRAIASRTLVLLVLTNVLRILPRETTDYFVAAKAI